MSKATPVNPHNAIEAATFALVLERSFNEREALNFLQLEHSLKQELPSFSRTSDLLVKLENDRFIEQINKPSGVILQRFNHHGKPEWILKANKNTITTTCLSYSRWTSVWKQAREFLEASSRIIDHESNRLVAVALQLVDRFVHSDGVENYRLSDVFRPDSKFLPLQTSQAGALWHAYQGWFEEFHLNPEIHGKCLNVLNLSTALKNNQLMTTIDHTIQFEFAELTGLPNMMVDGEGNPLQKLFNLMHTLNQLALKELLNNEQLAAIGLET
jgi:uncharacterized protein (TIGR04255 family)